MVIWLLTACLTGKTEQLEVAAAPPALRTLNSETVLDSEDVERIKKESHDQPFAGQIRWEAEEDAPALTLQYELMPLEKGYVFLVRHIDDGPVTPTAAIYTNADLEPVSYYNVDTTGCIPDVLTDACRQEARELIHLSFLTFGVKTSP